MECRRTECTQNGVRTERNAHRTAKISISRRFTPCHRDFQNKVSISPRKSGFSRFIEIPHSASQTASSQESLKFRAFSRLTMMLDTSRNLNISSKLPFARVVETLSNNLSTSRLEREILRLCYGAWAIGVGRSRRNGYGNKWYESKHVETSDVHPVSLPAAGDATEFAVWSGELSIARMPGHAPYAGSKRPTGLICRQRGAAHVRACAGRRMPGDPVVPRHLPSGCVCRRIREEMECLKQ